MKRLFVILLGLAAVSFCGREPSSGPKDVLIETSPAANGHSPWQLEPSARLPEAEHLFVESLKKAVRAKDKAALEGLYELKGVNPAFADVIPSVIEQLSALPAEGLEVSVEANNKATQTGIKYTVPYFGEAVFRYRGGQSGGTMRVPVGIRDGRYYLTAGALN